MRVAKAFEAGKYAVRHSIPRFLSLARELSLEVVGFLFFAFAVFFAFGPFGFVQAYRSLPESMTRLIVSAAGAIMFAWFGYDSFRRSKRLARKRQRDAPRP